MHALYCCAVLLSTAQTDLETALPRQAPTAVTELPREAQSLRERLYQAGRTESQRWSKLQSVEEWEAYRDPRIEALRRSLGVWPTPPKMIRPGVRQTHKGDGYFVDCLTFTSRPGLVVTANLYRPEKPPASMPGLLLVHSHHNPKSEGELQDMGAMWARAGCLVLVPDLLGHGERRQHPFPRKEDYPTSFRVGRQDYYFRYNLAVQLQTIGDSLMGWLCWDLMRCVDVLLTQPGIDRDRIGILGAVAGGGDPAAVTAALDRRITAAVVFNFGGPQPETRFPLPPDAESTFLYSGSGSWESTRNLAFSAREGFLPWLIVGSIAPRFHVYSHEFSWDEKRDPVWGRLQQIHAWYRRPHHLASTRGTGLLSGRPPEASHCNNIGPVHRRGIHEAFRRWFGIVAEEPTARERRTAEELFGLSVGEKAGAVHEIAGKLGEERAAAFRSRLVKLDPAQRRIQLRERWGELLTIPAKLSGAGVAPVKKPLEDRTALPGVGITRVSARGIMLLRPVKFEGKRPLVVAVAQGGPRWLLQKRPREITKLLDSGTAVALIDLGGPSQLDPRVGRGRSSGTTSLASSALMLGEPLLGRYVLRLREALGVLRNFDSIDSRQISLWGDSPSAPNEADRVVAVPQDVNQPTLAEPTGALVVLLTALFEEEIQSVRAVGGLASYASLLNTPFVHVPYDVVVPGALTAGDLTDLVAALAPRKVRLEGLVDGVNRAVPLPEAQRLYRSARSAYEGAGVTANLVIAARSTP